MMYNTYWYKALSCSCAVHLVIIMLLVIVLGNIDSQPLPEQHISIELTEVTGSSSQDSEPTRVSAVSPVSHAVTLQANQAKTTGAHPVVSPSVGQSLAGSESAVVATFAAGGGSGSGESSVIQPVASSGLGAAALKPAGGREIDSIINAFLLQIEKRKDYPYLARRRGQEGTVTVAVRLSEAGELAGVQVVRSSGVAALDEAALTLVRKVCPFSHNAGRIIAMNIPIAYQIE